MNMYKKTLALMLTIVSAFTVAFGFSGCNGSYDNSSSGFEEDVEFGLVYDKAGVSVSVDDFTLDYLYFYCRISGSEYKTAVTKDMISSTDLLKLTTSGTHVITVNYAGMIYTVTIILSDDGQTNVETMLVYTKEGKEVAIKDFSYGDLYLYERKSGIEKREPVTADMLSDADKEKLKTAGPHTITVNYNGKTYTATIILVEGSQGDKPFGGNYVYNGAVPSGYYHDVNDISGTALKLQLRKIISANYKGYSYKSDLPQLLPQTDHVVGDTSKMVLFYNRKIVAAQKNNNVWNKEHVWPRSKGWFEYSGAGSDMHHIRPTEISVNSTRGNKPFAESGGSSVFIPDKSFRGDIARILFYLMVRYSDADGYRVTVVATSMDMLLRWNREDPVDEWELSRNNETAKLQGNRNPFIDCEEFADMIWAA